jgi:hypothetical protein
MRGDSATQMPPEQRKNFFLLPAYYHYIYIIGSPGIAVLND